MKISKSSWHYKFNYYCKISEYEVINCPNICSYVGLTLMNLFGSSLILILMAFSLTMWVSLVISLGAKTILNYPKLLFLDTDPNQLILAIKEFKNFNYLTELSSYYFFIVGLFTFVFYSGIIFLFLYIIIILKRKISPLICPKIEFKE